MKSLPLRLASGFLLFVAGALRSVGAEPVSVELTDVRKIDLARLNVK